MKIMKYTSTAGMMALAVYFAMIGGCAEKDLVKSGSGKRSISMTALEGKSNVVPIAVIGSGPAGLSAATYAGRSKHPTVVFEGRKPGGLLMDTTMVDNWPGSPPTMGPDIINGLRLQADNAGAIFLPDTIEKADFSVWPYELTTEDGVVFHALAVVIATGATPRTLGIPGEQEYWGHGVTACAVCDAPFFKDEEVVVIGGGDSAVEQAIQLAPYAKKITVLIRKNRMRAAATMQDRLKSYDHIKLKYHVEIREICGDGEQVTGVKLYNNKTDSVDLFPTNGVFLAIGHDPNSSLFTDSLEMKFGGYIQTMGKSQETSVTGVFAAGEVEDDHYRQAGVSAGHGIKAALDAIAFLSEIGYDLKVAARFKGQLVRKDMIKSLQAPLVEVPLLKSHADFKKIIKKNSGKPVVLDFFAEYCSSCMAMLPAYAAVAQEFEDQAVFLKVDVGEHLDLAEEFGVYKVPCLLVFKDGELIERHTNAMSKQELTDFVQKKVVGDSA